MAAFDFSKLKLKPEADANFDYKPFNPAPGQAALKKQAADALRFVQGTKVRGMNDVSMGYEGAIRYRPTLYGQRIGIESADEDYFPVHKDQFATLIAEFTKAIEAGEYNTQIEAAANAAAEAARTAAEAGDNTTGAAKASSKAASTRVYDNVTKVSFKINGMSRGANPKSEKEIRAALLDEGFTKEDIDAAYKRRADKKKA